MRKLARAMKERRVVSGFFQFILHPDITEIAGQAGFDFVILDLEHSGLGIESARTCVLAAESTDIAPVVRVADKQQWMIEQAFDIGAEGVVVPTVETPEEIEEIIHFSKFHPRGRRGWCPYTRAARFGAIDEPEVVRAGDDEAMVIPLIETAKAIENLETICKVPGLECIFLGAGDLSVSLGLHGGMGNPVVEEKIYQATQTAANHEIVSWCIPSSQTQAQKLVELGTRGVIVARDIHLLMNGGSNRLKDFQEALLSNGQN